eukprot:CAMPEP_0202890636 /NCGR_PEP_ID=MMETSP1392-20130828/978_1 /ASSEMBLY_ACC=CAM_ASM_000868 /TAXON_ID=225041 /ORGANISM="Chlamydomonas chlamydogama, Strain SAG 11-48b" /LENGTH=408 /DNA_ID=CAMNT_0049574243 /DNA_START=120 /DNA_END=1342 /DNA_ORIENTATION=-
MLASHKMRASRPAAFQSSKTARAAAPRGASVRVRSTVVESPLLKGINYINPAWNAVDSEAKFFEVLTAEIAAGRCPKQLLPAWQDFFNNYKKAVTSSPEPGADEKLAAKVQASIADTVLDQFARPYTFPSLHQRIQEPYNYYEFGQRYVGSLIDYRDSVLGHPERWAQVAAQLAAGENVVLLANHQTEADPGVFAHMLVNSHPNMATDVIYVAGDRVVTDPLCKPFSMGRNLFCVHSKKHLDDVPELKAAKMETNRKTLVAMQRRLNEGGALIWIAPSGGRDRPKGEERKWSPDPFDPAAVELMRNLVSRAKRPGHLYPMAMYSWPIMPPPVTVDKALGERRITNFSPVGISLCQPLDVAAINDTASRGTEPEDKVKQQVALAKAAQEAVMAEYEALEAAIKDPAKRG